MLSAVASRPRAAWKRAAIGLAAAAAAAVVYVQISRPPAAVVMSVDGDVRVERGGREEALSAGQALAPASRLLTNAGHLDVALFDRARVSVGPEARLVVGQGFPAARLERGRAAFEVLPGKKEFRVETPAGDVVVVGTAFEIEIINRGEEGRQMSGRAKLGLGAVAVGAASIAALVHVSRGSVRVENQEGEVAVKTGQAVTLAAGEAPQVVESDDAKEREAAGRPPWPPLGWLWKTRN